MTLEDESREDVVEEEVVLPGEEEEVEFVGPDAPLALEDEEIEDPELRGLSKKELAARLREASAPKESALLAESFDKLTRVLTPKEAPLEPAPPPSLRLSPEEKKRLKEELYTAEDPGELLEDLFLKKYEAHSQDLVGRVSAKFAEQEGELLRSSNPEYKEFETEIKDVLASLSPAQRAQPGVHKWALEQAKIRNIDKIVERRVEKALGEALASKGKVVAPTQAKGGGGATGASTGSGKPRVFVDKGVWDREVERASARGVGPGSSMWPATRDALVKKYSKPSREKVEI